jgi:glycosyltransferase involved in cell wall biosynthesis
VLYDLCCGVVQTSLYEAGSWPMIEALDAGRAVACSAIPSIVEQVQRLGLEVALFDPADPGAVAESIAAMYRGGQPPETAEHNALRVRSRTWSAVADDYLRVLTRAAEGAPAQPRMMLPINGG